MIDMEAGDVVVVLRNNVWARRPIGGGSYLTCGEKVKTHDVVKLHSATPKCQYLIDNGHETFTNTIPVKDVEKIYYNDVFKAAWFLFGNI